VQRRISFPSRVQTRGNGLERAPAVRACSSSFTLRCGEGGRPTTSLSLFRGPEVYFQP
jgi:hypothetical protein